MKSIIGKKILLKVLFGAFLVAQTVYIFPAAEKSIPHPPKVQEAYKILEEWQSRDSALVAYKRKKRLELKDRQHENKSYALDVLRRVHDERSPGLLVHLRGHFNDNKKQYVGGHLGQPCLCGNEHTPVFINTGGQSCSVVVTPSEQHNQGIWCYESIKPSLQMLVTSGEVGQIEEFLQPQIEKYTQESCKRVIDTMPVFLDTLKRFAGQDEKQLNLFIDSASDSQEAKAITLLIAQAKQLYSDSFAFEVKENDKYYKASWFKDISDEIVQKKKLEDTIKQLCSEVQKYNNNKPVGDTLEEAIACAKQCQEEIDQQIETINKGNSFRPRSPFEDEYEDEDEDEGQSCLSVDKLEELEKAQTIKHNLNVLIEACEKTLTQWQYVCGQTHIKGFIDKLSYLHSPLATLNDQNDLSGNKRKQCLSSIIALKSKALINLRDKPDCFLSLLDLKKDRFFSREGISRCELTKERQMLAKSIDADQTKLDQLCQGSNKKDTAIVSFEQGIIEQIVLVLENLVGIKNQCDSDIEKDKGVDANKQQQKEKIIRIMHGLHSFVLEAEKWWLKEKHLCADWEKVQIPGAKGIFPLCFQDLRFEGYVDILINGILDGYHKVRGDASGEDQTEKIDIIVPLPEKNDGSMLVRACFSSEGYLKTLYPLMPIPPVSVVCAAGEEDQKDDD